MNTHDAILHDTQRAWAGSLEKITDYGCEMRIEAEEDSIGPHAARNARLTLQVLNSGETHAESLNVELDGIRRAGSSWIYRLTWASRPQL
jgi:hypothetical protein